MKRAPSSRIVNFEWPLYEGDHPRRFIDALHARGIPAHEWKAGLVTVRSSLSRAALQRIAAPFGGFVVYDK